MGQLPVLPKHWWEGKDFANPPFELPLGSGPYRVDGYEPGRSVTYRRVEDYWGSDVPAMRGRWNVDVIRYEYFRDRSEEHTSELQSLMRTSYAVFCLTKKTKKTAPYIHQHYE